MAGKNKGNDQVLSKTAQRSKGKVKDQGFQASWECPRVYSLAGGTYARILDPRDGRSKHLAVGSDSYFEVVSQIVAAEPHGHKMAAEIERMGFPLPVAEETE